MARQLSKLEALPIEVRTIIYKHLFQDSLVCVCRYEEGKWLGPEFTVHEYQWKVSFRIIPGDKRLSLLQVSKQIHDEAMPVYAASIRLHTSPSLYQTQLSWQKIYWPLIQTLTVEFEFNKIPDLSAFTSLKTVHVWGGELDGTIKLPTINDPDLMHKCLMGAFDNKIKAARKQSALQLLSIPGRRYVVICKVFVEINRWVIEKECTGDKYLKQDFDDPENYQLDFNLETMETVRREMIYDKVTAGGVEQRHCALYEDGEFNIWAAHGFPQLILIKPWEYDASLR
jgi:hypothetical protein